MIHAARACRRENSTPDEGDDDAPVLEPRVGEHGSQSHRIHAIPHHIRDSDRPAVRRDHMIRPVASPTRAIHQRARHIRPRHARHERGRRPHAPQPRQGGDGHKPKRIGPHARRIMLQQGQRPGARIQPGHARAPGQRQRGPARPAGTIGCGRAGMRGCWGSTCPPTGRA